LELKSILTQQTLKGFDNFFKEEKKMSFENLILEIDEDIAILTFNRPKAMNALNNALFDELLIAISEIKNNKNIKVLILTGQGEKSFIAGADISELVKMNPLEAKKFSRKGQKTFRKLEELAIPVIAAVNGFALGGGSEAALACDFIYASEKALFGLPEITLGLVPGFGGTQRLARLVGENLAKELIFTGNTLSAKEALKIGIANKVFPHDSLMENTLKTAKRIASMGKVALRAAKETTGIACDVDLETGTRFENDAFALCMVSSDAKEGTTAFLEKRRPEFKGELG
jgi:enoyl-CoA hydratase